MRAATVALVFLFLTLAPARGQISPGPLSKAHQSLNGSTQCSSCHKTGGGSAALKCQECHTEIAKELSQGRGLHSTFPNKETCAKCHSDHNGEDFPLIHWVPSLQDFDHKQTGYPLQGKHAGIECNSSQTVTPPAASLLTRRWTGITLPLHLARRQLGITGDARCPRFLQKRPQRKNVSRCSIGEFATRFCGALVM